MFNIYNKNIVIFNDKNQGIAVPFQVDVTDYEDSIVIETQISLGHIVRGWIGDLTIRVSGFEYSTLDEAVDEDVVYKDVLCCRRIFDQHHPDVASWKYTFMKY